MKFTEKNIIGVKFKNGSAIFYIKNENNTLVRVFKESNSENLGTWVKSDVVKYLNEGTSWIPLSEIKSPSHSLIIM